MFHKDGNWRRTWKGRAISLFLSAVLLLGSVPGFVLPASAHWADPYLDTLVDWGAMRADQIADPDTPLTRAEFMAIINRAYGYQEMGEMPFTDVLESDWFYDDVAIAYNAGYMKGTSATTASPNARLTREQAVCILGRNMMLKETPGEDLGFADSRSISGWARGMVKTAVNNYIVTGYPDDTFRPKNDITKGQMAVLVTQCVGTPVNQSGAYELGDVSGNLTITAPNVTLRNTTISGDLYVSGGVGLGGIKLENVNVLGRIVVSGTGESEAGFASVTMRNVTANEMLVDNMRGKTVTVRADGITEIPKTIVRTSAYLEDNNTDDKGLMSIELDGGSGSRLTLAGRIKEVIDKTPNSVIQVAKGTVAKLTVDEAAVNASVLLDRNTSVKEMNLDVGANVTGDGDIDQLRVNAPGCVVSMLPDKIYIRPGLTANIGGIVMDHQAAEEGSLDPRLLSGYPAARDITPTGLRADFSGNKKGTVYWAVSSITDGSIGEDNLISPPSYGSKAIRNGSVALATGGSEVSAQITGLAVGGSYYLSAVLVDDLGNRSPVKVIAFSTPDNTVPAFGQGYPYMSFVGKANEYDNAVTAQVAVMATKTCRMYYAVLPAGAAAPSPDELRSASVSSNLGYGVVEMEKNYVWDGDRAIIVSRRLDQQKDYVLYLWLTDGVNSSAVTSLAFSTPDVTPPEFVAFPKVNGDVRADRVPMTATINENGTIYWVAVKSGADYPLPNPGNDKENTEDGKTARLDSEYAKIQVANGMNAVSSGRVNATANTPVPNLNITGLQAETSYDVYFLIRDTAGNDARSVYKLEEGIRTLDTGAPTVRQIFTSVDRQDPTRPKRDTSIVLEFSENVRLGGCSKDLLSMYRATQEGTTSEREKALNEFVSALRRNIDLKIKESGDRPSVVRGNPGVSEDKWAVDFSKAQVVNEEGKIQLTFPNEENGGLRLESGGTYFFEVNINSASKITDLGGHEMDPSPVTLDDFVMVFAQINLVSNEFKLSDAHWPEAIKKENEDNEKNGVNIGPYKVNFRFRMRPEDTELVADGIAYDLLLWTDTNIVYDLYYRAVTGDPGKERVLTAERDENGFIYGMPNMSANPDANGWVKLGTNDKDEDRYNFGGLSKGRPGKSLHYTFNNCRSNTGDGLPDLNTLKSKADGQQVFYDFAIVVRELNREKNPDAWGKHVKFYVDVAAGYPSNVATLGSQNVYIDNWDKFLADKLSGGGGESLGSAERYENDPRQLFMEWDPEDKIQPEFSDSLPQFIPDDMDETKMTMRLGLKDNRGGNVYYVVGYANRNTGVPETSNTAGWEPSVTTKLVNGSTIRPELVPQNGEERTAGDPPMPELDKSFPPATNIQSPDPSWIEDSMVAARNPPGEPVVFAPGAEPKDILLEGLMPDRTYYAYFVITGSSDVPSEVQIYKFKTDPVSKPIIRIDKNNPATGANGRAEITNMNENMDIMLTYKVFTKQSATTLFSWLNTPLSEVLAAGITSSMLPEPYADMTVYDALAEPYDYKKASKDGTATQGKHFPTRGLGEPENYNKAYSVFDLYASNSIKTEVYGALSGDSMTSVMDGDNKEKEVRGGGTWNGADKLTPGVPFYVIAMARRDSDDDENNTEDQKSPSERYSFMGAELMIGNQSPADLTFITGNLNVDDDGNVTSGQIILSFNAVLYTQTGSKLKDSDIEAGNNFFTGTPKGIDRENSSVSNSAEGAGSSTDIILMLATEDDAGNKINVGAGGVSATVTTNKLLNEYKVPSGATLTINSRVVHTEDSDNDYYTYYIDVVWDAKDPLLKSLRQSIPVNGVRVTKPKSATSALPAASGASTNFTVSSANTVNGTSRISFDAPLYAGEDTPVTSMKQLAEIADEIEGIDLSQSRIVTSEDGTTLILKLKGKAEDVSLKINGGKLTNSAGEAAKEALSVQIEKRVETNQANAKLNNFYTDVSWGDQTWTDKGTNK